MCPVQFVNDVTGLHLFLLPPLTGKAGMGGQPTPRHHSGLIPALRINAPYFS